MTKRHIKRARWLANLLENQFKIGGFTFGLDPILGLIPGAGDFFASLLSLYILWIAIIHKLPSKKVLHMLWNICLDYVVGIIPLVGNIFDFAIKSNTKNLKIVEDHLRNGEDVLEGEVIG